MKNLKLFLHKIKYDDDYFKDAMKILLTILLIDIGIVYILWR